MVPSRSLRTGKPLVIGNWKAYIEAPDEAKQFATALKRRAKATAGVDVWIAPSFTLLPVLAEAFKKSSVKVGGQAVSVPQGGAHTGTVSAAMLKAAGASFCIVGHSEQRAAGVTDEAVHDQASAVVREGLVAVVCVGEAERDPGGAYISRLEAQLRNAFSGMQAFAGKTIVAYEPVWAIGKPSGGAMQPQELEETVIFIKKILSDVLGRATALKIPILYGGAVESENTAALMRQGGVQGLLVGRASTDAESFAEILKQCRP